MNILKIKETCIYVKDLERTRNFYEGQLGLKVISVVNGRHIFFKAGSSVLLCFIASETKQGVELPAHGAEGSVHFAFEVKKDDYHSVLGYIKDKSITILHEQEWKDGIRSFYFHDPDQNLVEVIEEGLWE